MSQINLLRHNTSSNAYGMKLQALVVLFIKLVPLVKLLTLCYSTLYKYTMYRKLTLMT